MSTVNRILNGLILITACAACIFSYYLHQQRIELRERANYLSEVISKNGLEAAQYQVALKQVEALTALGGGEGKQTIVLPSNAMDAFGDAFKMFRGSK